MTASAWDRQVETGGLIRRRWPPIEIIVTSGFLSADEIDLPERAAYFSKPYWRPEVVAMLRKMAP